MIASLSTIMLPGPMAATSLAAVSGFITTRTSLWRRRATYPSRLTRMVNQVGSPAMFDGNRFLPLTGIPIWKIARRSTVLAVWLPEPLTVATWMLKSLMTGFMAPEGTSRVQLPHRQALRLAHEQVRRVRRHAPLARGGEQELVLALVGHDVAAREDAFHRGSHVTVDFDEVSFDLDPPPLHRVEVHRRPDVDHQVVALEPERFGGALGLGHHGPDAAVIDLDRPDPRVEVTRDLHLVHEVDVALHPGEAVEHLDQGDLGARLMGGLGALEPRIAASHHHHPLARHPRPIRHAVGQRVLGEAVLARHLELARLERSAADRHDHRLRRVAVLLARHHVLRDQLEALVPAGEIHHLAVPHDLDLELLGMPDEVARQLVGDDAVVARPVVDRLVAVERDELPAHSA